jgi:hypothetical protein
MGWATAEVNLKQQQQQQQQGQAAAAGESGPKPLQGTCCSCCKEAAAGALGDGTVAAAAVAAVKEASSKVSTAVLAAGQHGTGSAAVTASLELTVLSGQHKHQPASISGTARSQVEK